MFLLSTPADGSVFLKGVEDLFCLPARSLVRILDHDLGNAHSYLTSGVMRAQKLCQVGHRRKAQRKGLSGAL